MPKYIRRWQKVLKGTPAYKKGYRWFDAKTFRHYKKLPKSAVLKPITKLRKIKGRYVYSLP